MTESEWLASEDPAAMLEWLANGCRLEAGGSLHPVRISERKLRLFACGCCRLVWNRLTDERSRAVVEVAERFADALATDRERSDARAAACWSSANLPSLAQSTCYRDETLARGLLDELEHEHGVSRSTQASLLREVVGNPFREQTFDPAWRTPTVTGLASRIYDQKSFDLLPILADGLEDAGCTDGVLLGHLRRQQSSRHVPECGTSYRGCAPDCPKDRWEREGSHVRGCWALDLILGEEDAPKTPSRTWSLRFLGGPARGEIREFPDPPLSRLMISTLSPMDFVWDGRSVRNGHRPVVYDLREWRNEDGGSCWFYVAEGMSLPRTEMELRAMLGDDDAAALEGETKTPSRSPRG